MTAATRLAAIADGFMPIKCASPQQVRHVARLVVGGLDPSYPPFADDAPIYTVEVEA